MTKVFVDEKFTELKDCDLMDGVKVFSDEVGDEVYGLIVDKSQTTVQVNYYDMSKRKWVAEIFANDVVCTPVNSEVKFTVER